MDVKDFYDSGIYIAIVAAAFVLVMLMLVLIGKLMGGPKKPDRKKKAIAPAKSETVLGEAPALPMGDSNTVQPIAVPSAVPVSSGESDASAMNIPAVTNPSKEMSLGDDIPKPEEAVMPSLSTQDLSSLEDDEEEQEDAAISEDDDEMSFFNVETIEEDTSISDLAEDLTDVDLNTLGELTKEISQLIPNKK